MIKLTEVEECVLDVIQEHPNVRRYQIPVLVEAKHGIGYFHTQKTLNKLIELSLITTTDGFSYRCLTPEEIVQK